MRRRRLTPAVPASRGRPARWGLWLVALPLPGSAGPGPRVADRIDRRDPDHGKQASASQHSRVRVSSSSTPAPAAWRRRRYPSRLNIRANRGLEHGLLRRQGLPSRGDGGVSIDRHLAPDISTKITPILLGIGVQIFEALGSRLSLVRAKTDGRKWRAKMMVYG
jgi:hypothetical protein